MGRQTRFHMLEEDCKQFLKYVQDRDPVVAVNHSSTLDTLVEVKNPLQQGSTYFLWNQSVLPTRKRKFVSVNPEVGDSYHLIDNSLPVIEFWYASPMPEPWNGRPAITRGRISASFENPPKAFGSWYDALIRWIRKNFIRDTVMLGDWIGPAAYQWFMEGGLLLPHLRPPVTSSWLS